MGLRTRRRRWLATGVIATTSFVACSFSTQVSQQPTDAAPPDAGPCPAAGTFECADANTLRACVEKDQLPVDTTCSWGCVATGDAHCGVVMPSGGAVTADDMKPSTFGAVDDVTIDAASTIDSAGTITNATGNFSHTLRMGGRVAVFRVKSLTINAPVTMTGNAAIAFIADGPIVINAVVSAKGPCGSGDMAAIPGPGGFAGGIAATDSGAGPGGGRVGSGSAGGGGGGHGGEGGKGGTGPAMLAGGSGGSIFGTATIDMLAGGGGGGATDGAGGRGRGGGGGGAVQLVSNTKIVLMSGGIDAGGCGGDSGQGGGDDGGGGGGAGGAILLEAPAIEGTGKLAVNGGGGGAGDDATQAAGAPSTLDRVPAPGATTGTNGEAGGPGAAGATFGGTKGVDATTHAGGGGGGIGRIRLNTRTGTVGATGEMSPALDDPNSTCTAGAAKVQ